MSTRNVKLVNADKIHHGDNVRLLNVERLDISGLASEIDERDGLTDPMLIHKNEDGSHEVIKGNRRLHAINHLKTYNELRYTELFKDGVPCFVIDGLSPVQVAALKVDQGNQMTLNHPFELTKAYTFIMDESPSLPEKGVICLLHGVLSAMHPIRGKRGEAIAKLRERISEYKEAGTLSRVPDLQREIASETQKFWHGTMQHQKRIYESPMPVFWAKWFNAEGTKHPDCPKDMLMPRDLTTEQVKNLHDAHKEDQKIESDGIPVHTRVNPGPAFKVAYDEIIAAEKQADGQPKPVRQKALSAKQMEEEVNKWSSEGFRRLTASHAGKEQSGLGRLDKDYADADLVLQKCRKEFDALVKVAKG